MPASWLVGCTVSVPPKSSVPLAVDLKDAAIVSFPSFHVALAILAAVAEFEREMIRERVVAGLANARHRGKQLGRRKLLFDRDRALNLHRDGKSIREIADALQINRGTIHRFLLEQKGASGPGPPKSARLPKAA